MDGYDDDIRILSDSEEDPLCLTTDRPSPAPFLLGTPSSGIVPASTHALQTAYRNLTKRYNHLEQTVRLLKRQARSSQRMASENAFVGGDVAEEGAAAMADHSSVENQAKQGYINHLTRQVNLAQTKVTLLETQLCQVRQLFHEFREKHKRCGPAVVETLAAERDRACMELETTKARHAAEITSLQEAVANLTEKVHQKKENHALNSQTTLTAIGKLDRLELEEGATGGRPSSTQSSHKGVMVVKLEEFVQMTEQLESCQQNMTELQRVVKQQCHMIRQLQPAITENADTDSDVVPSFVPGSQDLSVGVVAVSLGRTDQQLHLDSALPVTDGVQGARSSHYLAARSRGTPTWPCDSSQISSDRLSVASDRPAAPSTQITVNKRAGDRAYGLSYPDTADSEHTTVSRTSSSPVRHTGDGDRTRNARPPSAPPPMSQWGALSDPVHPTGSRTPSYQTQTHSAPALETIYSRASRNDSNAVDINPGIMANLPMIPETAALHDPAAERRPQPTENPAHEAVTNDTSKVCPICSVNFSQLFMTDFQNHVFDCYDNTDSGELVRPGPSTTTDGLAGGTADHILPRVCPVCSTDFHEDIPQTLFERHVHEHFGEPPNIVDDFAILNP